METYGGLRIGYGKILLDYALDKDPLMVLPASIAHI